MHAYQAELDMVIGILRQFNLRVIVCPFNAESLLQMETGPRRIIMKTEQRDGQFTDRLRQSVKSNTIYHVSDEFLCHYTALRLPDCEEDTLMIIGPYMNVDVDMAWIERYANERGIHPQWISILESYYREVPCLRNEKILSATLNSFGEKIWGLHQFSSEEIIGGLPESCMPLASTPENQLQEDALHNIKKVEEQYESENQFMQMISQGRSHRVNVMLSNFSRGIIENRTEPIRNIKNYSIILNTLMRKAAERGGVHPIYIDRLSSEFARKIETTALWDDFMSLWQDMAKKYCLLVKNHSTKNYSQLVQRTIARIELDLTADLSLKANAEALNVNASYLSTLFKKETGVTLTDYVNRKRIEHAIYLLNTTTLPISVVGQRCGIADDNYFTKIFKKYTMITPKQFRSQNNHLKNI